MITKAKRLINLHCILSEFQIMAAWHCLVLDLVFRENKGGGAYLGIYFIVQIS